MELGLFQWVINLVNVFSQFFNWLNTPLPYVNFSPLMIISFGGITFIIGFLALRLIIGG